MSFNIMLRAHLAAGRRDEDDIRYHHSHVFIRSRLSRSLQRACSYLHVLSIAQSLHACPDLEHRPTPSDNDTHDDMHIASTASRPSAL